MIRKMQIKARTLNLSSTAWINLLLTGAVLAFIMSALTIMLIIAPARAAEAHGTSPEPLTVWTDSLPAGFQSQAARAGLDVVGIERLKALESYILIIHSAHGLGPEGALQVLNGTFPAMEFEMMNGGEDAFALIEN